MKIVLDPRAVEDLRRIHDRIAAEKPAEAPVTIARILSSIEMLGRFDVMARVGRVEGTREWVIPRLPCIVVYTVDIQRDVLNVIAILRAIEERSGV